MGGRLAGDAVAGRIERCRTIVAATIAAALLIAWSSNLYNFMDGTDGLAATMGAVGFGAYGWCMAPATAAWRRTSPTLGARVLRARRGDRPVPRRQPAAGDVFLGDVGAVPLGFLAAAFGLAGIAGGRVACVVPAARVPAVHRRCDA